MADALAPRTASLFSATRDGYLPTVTQLVALLLALVGSDEQLESLLEQQSSGDVRAEVAASPPKGVWTASVLGFGVTPQYIDNLSRDADRGGQLSAVSEDRFLFVGLRVFFFFLLCFTFVFPNFDPDPSASGSDLLPLLFMLWR